MWKVLLFIVAVITWSDPAQGQREYLTTVNDRLFFKIRVSGPMTNANVKATCEAEGMRYPCYLSGTAGCINVTNGTTYWTEDCITYGDTGVSCYTHEVLSANLCGDTNYNYCQSLDDTFVYIPGGQSDDSAWGLDYDNHTWGLRGANYNNMYALCAAEKVYLTTLGGLEFVKVPAVGAMTNPNVKATCEAAHMWHPCGCSGSLDFCHQCDRDSYVPCIVFLENGGSGCLSTLLSISKSLCGYMEAWNCQPLENTFVYFPDGTGNGAMAIDNVQVGQVLHGANYNNMYALCAVHPQEVIPDVIITG
ncbi:uncharacterized protein LOC118414651 [Branchiostoma floridae]|uniref:Uncharacterized protein LOC118414651 n=1 Tax=Branchiostoma floridae TaxID=7739 RepID=A0A9J7L2I7_BRAFL|nr:uncharacterized protein LOC118414651 [Branchiostoma floridae]